MKFFQYIFVIFFCLYLPAIVMNTHESFCLMEVGSPIKITERCLVLDGKDSESWSWFPEFNRSN